MVELTRLPSRRQAEELRFVLEGGGILVVVEPLAGTGNGSGPLWAVLVAESQLPLAQEILREELPREAQDLLRQGRPAPQQLAPRTRPALAWTAALVVVNLLVWIAQQGSGGSENRQTLLRFGASHAPSLRAGQWWRLVSATFLHIGLRHLLANMFTLALLSPAVMQTWGVGRSYFLYLVTGVVGNLVSFTISPTGAVKAGASGCILGLLGVLAGTRIRDVRAERRAPSRFKTWHIVAMLVAFYGFVVGVGPADHLAHLGGLLAGALLALVLPRPGQLSPRTDRALAWALGSSATVAAAGAGLAAYLFGR